MVTDYSEAVFIHRGTVKRLNVDIKKLGGEKVVILKEVRDFRRGIALLQWENTRSDMIADDLVSSMLKEWEDVPECDVRERPAS